MHATRSKLILIALSCASFCSAQVPTVYQDLYTQLTTDVSDFQGAISRMWDGSVHPIAYAGQLTDANSNNGPALLQSSSFDLINSQIAYLKSVGVKAISVEVSFPMLNQSFLDAAGPNYQSQFATFYANVASAIRAQGLKVIVESQSMIPSGLQSQNWPTLVNFYASFTSFTDYAAARAQTAAVVAQTMQPDYFVLQEEPDTEASQSGQVLALDVSGSTMMLSGSIAAVRAANVPGVKVGAGFGSWLQEFQLFANSFTQQHCGENIDGQIQPCIAAPLDFLDMHIFPIMENTTFCSPPPNPAPCTAPNFWQNALTMVSTGLAANIPMSISQCWLRKARDSEWPPAGGLGDIQEAREAYSFWQPVDIAFLHAIYSLGNYANMQFVTPFNTQNMAAYLTWTGGSSTCRVPSCTAFEGEGGGNTPAEVFAAVQQASQPINGNKYTDVGIGYASLLQTKSLTIRLAAAGQVEPFAPQALLAAYGANLATTAVVSTPPLSTSLGGVTVTVTDGAGTARPANLFYVSPTQINFEIPAGSAPGDSKVTLRSDTGAIQNASIQIANTSPGLFQLNSSGLVSAWILPVISGVQQSLLPVYELSALQNIVPVIFDLSPSTQQIYLEMYGTGIRNAASVTVTVAGTDVPVLFYGPAPGYEGLDQVNIGPLPSSLAGQGSLEIVLNADGQIANTVTFTVH